MDKTIRINVRDKIATRISGDYVCGNSDYTAVFALDDEWENVGLKTARFVYNGAHKDIVFTGNNCPVPIISGTHSFNVGIYAGDLQTTTPAYVPAKKSILCDEGLPADPEPDVYAQFMEQIAKLSAGTNMYYTTLEKLDGDLVVKLHGSGADLTGAQLRVLYFVQNKNKYPYHEARGSYWRHPANFDVVDSPYRWGYAQLAGQEICSGNEMSEGLYYPEAPSWMPNDGYMQTVFSINKSSAAQGAVVVDLKTWLLPLLKPNIRGTWKQMGLFGINKVDKGTIHIRFDLYAADGTLLGECKNVLHVGANRNTKLEIEGEAQKNIDSKNFLRSIT